MMKSKYEYMVMQKAKTTATIFMTAILILFSACYDDHTNTDFDTLEEIKIDSIGSAFTLMQDADTLVIEPVVSSNLDSDWEYSWDYYHTKGGKELVNLSHEKNLEQVLHLPIGNYTLVFTATNKKTGVSGIKTLTVDISSPYACGWYVLKDDGESTDLDLFASDNRGTLVKEAPATPEVENIITIKNGKPMPGKAQKMAFNTSILDGGNPLRGLMLTSERDYGVYNTADMSLYQNMDNCSFLGKVSFNPEGIIAGRLNNFLLTDGVVYASSTGGSGYFSYPVKLDRNEEKAYKLAPFTASRNFQYFKFYDELSESFLTGDMYMDNLTTAAGTASGDNYPAPVHMGYKCLYMGSSSNNGYGVFEHKTTGQRVIMSFSIYGNPNPYINERLDDADRLNKADMITIANTVKVLFFLDSSSGDVYSHMIDASGAERMEFDVPADETVTFIRHIRHYYYDPCNHIAVATSKGNGKDATYTIRFFSLSAGHFVLDEERTLTGKGYAKDVNFISTTGSTIYFNYSGIYK